MLKTLTLCSDQDRHCAEVGSSIFLKIKASASFTPNLPGSFLEATVTAINISEETVVPVEKKAYDPCTKKFVTTKEYGTETLYCYTLEYDDAALNPSGSVITSVDIEDYFCLSPVHEILTNTSLSSAAGILSYTKHDGSADAVALISTDEDNKLSVGADGGLYLDCDTITGCFTGTLMTHFYLGANVGPTQLIQHNQTLSVLGGVATSTYTSVPDKVHVDVNVSAVSGNQISIAVDGGLYVASTDSGGTDSLVNVTADAGSASNQVSGARKAKHTAVNGSEYSFYEGFKFVRVDEDCINKGIGSNKMVRGCSINSSGSLIIDAAPEHCAQAAGTVRAGNFDDNDITVSGITRDFGATPPLLIGNSANCRAMNGLWFAVYSTVVSAYQDGVWAFKGYIAVNEGPSVLVTNQRYGSYPGLTGTTWESTKVGVAGGAAGNTIIVQASMQIVTEVSSVPSSVVQDDYSFINLNYMGGTC